jgi:hypothetical protein
MGHQPKTLSRLVWMSKTESFVTENYACVYVELGPIFCDYTKPGVNLSQSKVNNITLSRTLSHNASHFLVSVGDFLRAASTYLPFLRLDVHILATEVLPFSDPFVYPPP